MKSLDLLAPGVVGYAMADERSIYIPVIHAVRENSGDVGRFLDRIAASGGPYKIPNVVSDRLEGMLRRRGWTRRIDVMDGVDVWDAPGVAINV